MKRIRLLRAAVRRKAPSPLGALARGLVAGAAGAGAQSLFFALTKKWAPKTPPPPPGEGKPEGEDVSSLEAVATRLAGGMMKRGPLPPEQKARAASAVHYLFGAAWGGVYALCRESLPRISPLLFGACVWMASDNLILPAFRLAAWPHRYPLKVHHYALHAHFAYGLATAGTYALLRDLGPVPLGAIPAMIALQAWAWLLRTPPARLLQRRQAWPRRMLYGTLVQKAALA